MSYTIIFNDLLTKEKQEKEFNTLTESHAIDLLKREYASTGIQILEIIDNEEQKIYNKINQQKEEQIKQDIKQIESTIKAFIKKPYTTSNKIKEKTIICKNIYDIKEYLNNKYNKYCDNGYLIDDKIEIGIILNDVTIRPTQEYFLKAE